MSTEAIAEPVFDDLPAALHLEVLSFLPLVERVRCALVSRKWAALLADPSLWAELNFEGASKGAVDNATLLKLCKRAGDRLRGLNLSAPALDSATLEGLLDTLSAGGRGSSLVSLSTWLPGRWINRKRIDFPSLIACCPALAHAAVDIEDSLEGAMATLRLLPGPGRKRVSITELADGLTVSDLAESLVPALAASSVAELELRYLSLEPLFSSRQEQAGVDGGVPETEAEAAARSRAIAQLAKALAGPSGGLTTLGFASTDLGLTPLLDSICRALSADSPLCSLDLSSCNVTGESATLLAELLSPRGPARLETLNLSYNDMRSGGCAPSLVLTPCESVRDRRDDSAQVIAAPLVGVALLCFTPLARIGRSER